MESIEIGLVPCTEPCARAPNQSRQKLLYSGASGVKHFQDRGFSLVTHSFLSKISLVLGVLFKKPLFTVILYSDRLYQCYENSVFSLLLGPLCSASCLYGLVIYTDLAVTVNSRC